MRFVTGLMLMALLCSPALSGTYEVAQQHPGARDDGAGTPGQPWKTLASAAEKVKPGDVVLIRGGVYRERVVVKAHGTAAQPIRFLAAPGEQVVLTGADHLTSWTPLEQGSPIHRAPWPYRFITWNSTMTHPNDDYHSIIGRCEQVMVQGYGLRQVLNTSQLAPGTFMADTDKSELLVWDFASRNLKNTLVEASVRQEVLRIEGDHVHIKGMRFRYAANMAQHGAVVLAGKHNVLEDCVVDRMNSSGASFQGPDAIARRCIFRDNGQLGFSASRAHRLLVTECLVEDNNLKGFDRGWEAGGNKLVLCKDAVLERSRFLRNRGNGIWFDIGNTNCTVRHCLIAENEDAGIFYEISFALHAHDNVIMGNGFSSTPGAWGAQAGISLSSSPGCVIERNVLAGNREGFNFREQMRTTPTIEDRTERPVWNHDELIRHNIIALNKDAQVWGWFDVKDNRHWPAAGNSSATPPLLSPPVDMAAPYKASTRAGQPEGLALESLRLRFQNNIYFAAPGQGAFVWGPTWRKYSRYATVEEFRTALNIDRGGRTLDPQLSDPAAFDLRIDAKTMSLLQDMYPRGRIPGVLLGLK